MSTVDGGHQQDKIKKEVVTMMMNATEAKKNVATYVATEAEKILTQLSAMVEKRSTEGQKALSYYMPNSVRNDVRDAVLSAVKEAGYNMRYVEVNRGLHINWEE